MTATAIVTIAQKGVFRPRGQFGQLAADHVPFDHLTGERRYESAALDALLSDQHVGVIGSRGAGKSSLISYVCSQLPKSHVALRVPVTGADDPTSVSVVAAVALGQALDDLELERYQQDALRRARADADADSRTPAGLRGGTLGGGPVPAEIHGELGTLREQLITNRLAGDRLAGLDRLITILSSRGLTPIFVMEDTEAAVGGAERTAVAEAFLDGPVRAFLTELECPSLIAIQTAFTDSDNYAQLLATMRPIEIPRLADEVAVDGLRAIISNRLGQFELATDSHALLADDVIDPLVALYHETSSSLRFTLAALQAAAEYAADVQAERIGAGHMRAALTDWRERITG